MIKNNILYKLSIPLILASSSLRRLEILRNIGFHVDGVVYPDINETPAVSESVSDYVKRMAIEKASVCSKSDCIVISGDTVVSVGRNILGKAKNEDEAKIFLKMLSGRRHRVYSSVCCIDNLGIMKVRLSVNIVQFRRISDDEIGSYLSTNEWIDKAGGYGIQGVSSVFVKRISGSYSAIVGFSSYDIYNLLKQYIV